MAAEQEPRPALLTSIHLDLHERTITFAAEGGGTRLTFTPRGILYELLAGDQIVQPSARIAEAADHDQSPIKEKEPPVTLPGKLMTQPKPGRPDRRGNATAWAMFAAHEEGRDTARALSTTFHRHTAKIALSLEKDAQIVAQGYIRPSTDPERADAFSVFNLVNYPGKPTKQEG